MCIRFVQWLFWISEKRSLEVMKTTLVNRSTRSAISEAIENNKPDLLKELLPTNMNIITNNKLLVQASRAPDDDIGVLEVLFETGIKPEDVYDAYDLFEICAIDRKFNKATYVFHGSITTAPAYRFESRFKHVEDVEIIKFVVELYEKHDQPACDYFARILSHVLRKLRISTGCNKLHEIVDYMLAHYNIFDPNTLLDTLSYNHDLVRIVQLLDRLTVNNQIDQVKLAYLDELDTTSLLLILRKYHWIDRVMNPYVFKLFIIEKELDLSIHLIDTFPDMLDDSQGLFMKAINYNNVFVMRTLLERFPEAYRDDCKSDCFGYDESCFEPLR